MSAARDHDNPIQSLLDDLLPVVRSKAPHLEWLLGVFGQEALVGRQWLDPELRRLAPGAEILEVGAGLMLLSCQLSREGFRVTALEPVGDGFSSFSELQRLILDHAVEHGFQPQVVELPVEELTADGIFDFAFSINVMEHVGDVPAAIANTVRALRPGGVYRFSCGNYLFPYEHHFGLPIIWNKTLTKKIFARRIAATERVGDPEGLWKSLNWISVPMVRRAVRQCAGASVSFDGGSFEKILNRVVADPQFAARRSPILRLLIQAVVAMGLHRLARLVPPDFQPLMDCSITRQAKFDLPRNEISG